MKKPDGEMPSTVSTITCTATQEVTEVGDDGKKTTRTITKTASCEVEVGATIPVTGVAFKNKSVTVAKGRTVQLNHTISPSTATITAVDYRTTECPDFNTNYAEADYKTAKVDHRGLVTAKEEGEITVTIRTKGETIDGELCTDTCTVKVVAQELGDVSGDGKINVKDVNMVARLAAKLGAEGADEAWADVSGDGKINVKDVNLVARYAAKLIDSFN